MKITVTSPQDNHEKTTRQIQAEIDFMRAMYERELNKRRERFDPITFLFCYGGSGLIVFAIIAIAYYFCQN